MIKISINQSKFSIDEQVNQSRNAKQSYMGIKKRTCLSISGKRARSFSIKGEEDILDGGEEIETALYDLGGEKRTGEEEEQRILLETGGLVTVNSSKKDLFPHTMADIVSFSLLFFFSSLARSLSRSYLSISTLISSFNNRLLFIQHRSDRSIDLPTLTQQNPQKEELVSIESLPLHLKFQEIRLIRGLQTRKIRVFPYLIHLLVASRILDKDRERVSHFLCFPLLGIHSHCLRKGC